MSTAKNHGYEKDLLQCYANIWDLQSTGSALKQLLHTQIGMLSWMKEQMEKGFFPFMLLWWSCSFSAGKWHQVFALLLTSSLCFALQSSLSLSLSLCGPLSHPYPVRWPHPFEHLRCWPKKPNPPNFVCHSESCYDFKLPDSSRIHKQKLYNYYMKIIMFI